MHVLRRDLREKLAEMKLHEQTGDPHDEGYMAALQELAVWLVDDRPSSAQGAVDPEMPRVFFRDIEQDPGWEVRVFFPGDEVAIEPGTWQEYVPAPAEGAVADDPTG